MSDTIVLVRLACGACDLLFRTNRYLDASKVMALRKEFLSKHDGLARHEFVFVMQHFLRGGRLSSDSALRKMSDTVLVSNLCELFEQVRCSHGRDAGRFARR